MPVLGVRLNESIECVVFLDSKVAAFSLCNSIRRSRSDLLSPQIKVFDTWQKGDHKEARRLFELILPVMAFSNQRIDVSGHFWKYVRVQLFFLCALSPYG